MLCKFRYVIIIIIVVLGCLLGSSAHAWWDTTYWDEVRYYAPSWTPEGKICFIKEVKNNSKTENIPWPFFMLTFGTSANNFGEPEYYLCTMNINGSDKKEIAKMPKGFKPDLISWARNNSIIVLSGKIFEKGVEATSKMATLRADGTNFKYITSGTMADVSADGLKIVYVNHGIWISSADGNNQNNILTNGTHPLWSPNGEMIAFEQGSRIKEINGVYLFRLKDKQARKVSDKDFFNWESSGNYLWTFYGLIDLNGNVVKGYLQERNNKPIPTGPLAPDGSKIVSDFNRDDFYIGDVNDNKIYSINAFQEIKYG